MNIAIVGTTGKVGRTILEVLEKKKFPIVSKNTTKKKKFKRRSSQFGFQKELFD